MCSFLKEIGCSLTICVASSVFQTKFSDVHMETGAISSFLVLAGLFLAQHKA